MKRKYISILALALIATATSCESTPIENENFETILINPVLSELRKGFKTTGSLKITESYFDDVDFQIPDEQLETQTTTYKFDITFQDNNNYQGVDRRYYQVLTDTDGKEYDGYYMGENSYNLNGYAALNYLDYNNEVVSGYAVDANYELVPYGSNSLLNPFKLLQRNDFTQNKDGFTLSAEKVNIIFEGLFSLLEGYQDNISYVDNSFKFTESTLTSATFTSQNMETKIKQTVPSETEDYHQTYIRYKYEVEMNFENIGTANAKDLIKIEPEKEENLPLKNALASMNATDKITVTRRIHPFINGEYVGEDTYLTIYQLGGGLGGGIYSQAYTLPPEELNQTPAEPSANDFFLRVENTNRKMRIYLLNSTTGEFSKSPGSYANLDNQFYFEGARFNWNGLNANIFTYNEEDGSYSPTDDNLPYITRDLFMSTFDMFNPVDNGYVTSVKIFVNDDQTCIDHIDVNYEDHVGYSGLFQITFSDLGSSHTPFDLVIAE